MQEPETAVTLRSGGRVRFTGALRSALASGCTALVLLACAPTQLVRPDEPVLAQPPNVGDAKIAATAYYNSGAYERDITAVTAEASAWLTDRAPQVDRPALVLDIDDTALTNWEVIVADDFGRVFDGPCDALPKGPCGWVAWDLRAATPAITQTLAFFEHARALGVTVFFITGRDESQRAATEKNLSAVGFGDHGGLYMEAVGSHYASAADFKAPQRAEIEAEGLHHRRQYGRSAFRPRGRARGEDVSPAQPLLPDSVKRNATAGVDIAGDRPTITCCRIGERSSHSWFVLKYLLGYGDVKNYDGSWTEWGNLVGAPVERG